MERSNEKLIISVIKRPKSSLLKKTNYIISLVNKETSLTEKIISNNIQFKNLKFKVVFSQLQEMKNVIKSKFIQEHDLNEKKIISYIDYTPRDFTFEMNDVLENYLYKIKVYLIEKINTIENIILESNQLLVNLKYGLINQKVIDKLYYDIYKPKKYFSQSEKDNIKSLTNEMKIRDMEDLLSKKDIQSFTYEGRTYENITQFIDSKNKASKLMDEKRKKKILFSTHTNLFFKQKMQLNDKENPFMKNEWFMGPIYSYDHNYDEYI